MATDGTQQAHGGELRDTGSYATLHLLTAIIFVQRRYIYYHVQSSSTAMPFASLPCELVFHIAAYLSKLDLLSLATTDHYGARLAQQLLYRDLHVSSYSHNLSLVITLAKKPHIAAHVRSFALHVGPSTILFRSFYDALRTALSNMSDLTSLQLFFDPTCSSAIRSVDGFSDLLNVSAYLAHDHHVAFCLAKPDLDFRSLTDATERFPEAFPHFGKLLGPGAVTRSRPVESSTRSNSGNILESVAAKLAKSTVPVILFEANIDSLSIPFLLSLSRAMPRLRYLRFTATSNNVQPPSNVGHNHSILTTVLIPFILQEFCDDVAKILSFFPALESFELWGIHFEQARSTYNSGQQWRAKMFGSSDIGESHLVPPPDLFSEDFMVY